MSWHLADYQHALQLAARFLVSRGRIYATIESLRQLGKCPPHPYELLLADVLEEMRAERTTYLLKKRATA